jgi:hypothetical protein
MNKYPLIGVTILAVVLLILGSLSNVVGYQSIQSSGVNDSPLFNVRTQRATNQQQNSITSQYLGKGIESNLYFPKLANRIVSLQQFIERIGAMNENEFGRFKNLVKSSLSEEKKDKNLDMTTIVLLLKQIRVHTNIFKINRFDKNSNNKDPPTFITCFPACWTYQVFPHCFIDSIIILVVFILMVPFFPIFRLLTLDIACDTMNCQLL